MNRTTEKGEKRMDAKAKVRTKRSVKSAARKTGEAPKPGKRQWEKPKAAYLGRVDQVVRGGGGKLSIPAADPGEPARKPRGQDH
jgi:hypothetical protein